MNNDNNNTNNETPEMPGTPEQEVQNSIQSILAGIDFEKISKDDVFHDLMHNAKLFSFRLMVASALLEQLHLRQITGNPSAQEGQENPDNVVRFNEQEQEPKS
jgi:hypothetical protein